MPSDSQLRAASEHVLYEIEMLFGTYRALDEILRERANGVETSITTCNALIESWTVHVRNVTAFLYPHRPRGEDILAEHYVENWSDLRAAASQDLGVRATRINTEIVHLSYARVGRSATDKQWELADITQSLRSDIERFISVVPSDRVQTDFCERVRVASLFFAAMMPPDPPQ